MTAKYLRVSWTWVY